MYTMTSPQPLCKFEHYNRFTPLYIPDSEVSSDGDDHESVDSLDDFEDRFNDWIDEMEVFYPSMYGCQRPPSNENLGPRLASFLRQQ